MKFGFPYVSLQVEGFDGVLEVSYETFYVFGGVVKK